MFGITSLNNQEAVHVQYVIFDLSAAFQYNNGGSNISTMF